MNAIVRGAAPPRRTTVVVIGAGQAGLSSSYYLSHFGVDHVVLERGRVGNSWRTERWDSLSLLTPNWQSSLPGMDYVGDDPDGFMQLDEVIGLVTDYAQNCGAPVEEYTCVTGVKPWGEGYRVCTGRGDWVCASVIVASGAFNKAQVPGLASALPAKVAQFTTQTYRNPGQLGTGGVLVVGAAASGVQIAEEVQRSGRQVTLAVGEHVRMPRRYRGRDIQCWMHACGLLDEDWRKVDDLSRVRRLPSAQLLGSPDNRDVDINALRAQGVEVAGRLAGIDKGQLQFSGGLANVTRLADLKLNRLLDTIDRWIDEQPGDAGLVARPATTALPEKPRLNVAVDEIETVIWATGYRPDYSWLELPILDRRGRPEHRGGVTALPGVYLMGLPYMRRRQSSFIAGAGEDARDICHHLLNYLGRPIDWYWKEISA